jgi:hypothetical protein
MAPITTWSQLTVHPLEGNRAAPSISKKKFSSARTEDGELSLPFWDDFSFTTEDHADDLLWIKNRSVLVSSGQGINPPTINVATFDGLNENGSPYNSTDPQDYGYRDTLESQTIKMTEVTLPFRNSVFLSFFYQAGGNGEPPDPSDFLRLEFLNVSGTWDEIVKLQIDHDMELNVFYDTLIRINQAQYYHDIFQFRFVSFGRRSGRFDSWHIDNVY